MSDDAKAKIAAFASRLEQLRLRKNLSERAVCDRIGRSATYLRPYLKGTAKKLPDPIVIMQLSEVLGTTIDDLLRPSFDLSISPVSPPKSYIEKQAERLISEMFSIANSKLNGAHSPTIDDVLNWISQTGGQIHQDNPMSQFVDLHAIPEATDKILQPHHVGAHSLAAQRLGTPSPELLRKMMETMGEDEISKVVVSYKQVSDKPFQLSKEWISIKMPDDGIEFTTDYYRLLHEVADARGGKYILCFSTLAAPKK